MLIDRDGVLNANRDDYVKTPDELEMIAGAAEAVARLNRAGHRVAVVTNQSCIGRGIIDRAMLERIHDRLRRHLAAAGARLDDILVCPDPPWDAGEWRKPRPGMLREAIRRFGAVPAETHMIGDALSDLEAAARLGCPRILVRTGHGRATQARGLPEQVLPVAVHDDLGAAVDALLGERGWS